MAKVNVYNAKGSSTEQMDLSDAIFAVAVKPSLVQQVYLTLEANARQPWAHVKTKGEVRGGGKKPWKQKGTGRARHGSIRSPLWKGGGVTFGPRNDRNFAQKVNKKMNRQAVRMCLTGKVQEDSFVILDDMPTTGKTRDFVAMRNTLPGAGYSTLILTNSKNDELGLSTRNIPEVHLQRVQDVNVADLLHHKYVIVTKQGVSALEERLAK
ncbi:MAG: 50S ribosomal protein L4 [Candidatus Magasanikbacteria bacterium CG10_big_fil_rev_8_21_14_0_10_47_10]|uniref:Large ribosomal subunit protein uL4 n=1 Tax=Candidatus Magasanikbacteria bacterium CG10_big_fil_rev_8_21_14_0_10_47_10 TaxID=1974652 RepID=A0A2H0TRE4_9BACT|nr:MAG: 50S ribosomal protein L4 [Candidatus Magasanikbacteria bacterium CG10_big_fil_rev_8_21_14_0_10_47_10]